MANLLRKLLPKQEDFFRLFNLHAAALDEAARVFAQSIEDGRHASGSGLDSFVQDGREVSSQILDRLRDTFVTPFDRADIKSMTSSMQALLEDLHSLGSASQAGKHANLQAYSGPIVECACALRKGVELLGDLDKHAESLKQICRQIAGQRRHATALRDAAVLDLLSGPSEKDPIRAMASVRVLDRLTQLVEQFDRIADRIDNLVLDHV